MSLENRNTSNREFKSLQKSYENWETGEPSADLWENLETDLAVSAVWDRLDETLELNGSSADKSLTEAYENWSPNSSGDGWSKLEEQLSRERVWQRLNTTLSYPVTTRIPWLKMAAASLVFVFTAFYTDHLSVRDENEKQSGVLNLASVGTNGVQKQNEVRNLASNGTIPAGGNEVAVEKTNQVPVRANAPAKQLAVNGNNTPVNDIQNRQTTDWSAQNNSTQTTGTNPVNSNTAQADPHEPAAESTTLNAQDLADLELSRREIAYSGTNGTIEEFNFLPFKGAAFKPRFSVLAGGQFAFINEKNRSAFSSSLPSMGIAADVQYHAYSGKVRFTQDIGFSQYAQSNGSYVNGRYVNSNQKLNTIYLMSSIGYTFKGVTVSGGITVNRLLNGYEESRTAITNVYNSKKLQVGATAGIDYHFTPFKNRTAMGVGVQYQLVSKLKSENTVFNDIQGVKLQIKYSF